MYSYSKQVPLKELQHRIEKLQKAMVRKNVTGVLIVQKTDLFYFSGTGQQGWLYVPEDGAPLLMIFKEFDRGKAESSLEKIVSLSSSKKIPQVILDHGYSLPSLLGMELDVLPANLFFQYISIFKQVDIVDISYDIRLIRSVKSEFEIQKIRDAALLSDKLANRFSELLVIGKTEIELAGELESYARSLGHQGIVRMRLWGSELFYGHLLSGAAAAVPSYLASPTGGTGVSAMVGQGASFKKIAAGEPVLLDYVFSLDGYLSDHARIFSIGDIADDLKAAHEAMLAIQETIMAAAMPGVESGILYNTMNDLALKKGYGDCFMGVGERRIRFAGHGIGLELDEFPFIAKGQKLCLQEGMVIALEPKVIFPGRGVVGIENTHLVTRNGLEALTVYPDAVHVVSQ